MLICDTIRGHEQELRAPATVFSLKFTKSEDYRVKMLLVTRNGGADDAA